VREITVRGIYSSTLQDLRDVVALAQSGRLDLSGSVTHTADRPTPQKRSSCWTVARPVWSEWC
jgi:hypothetical protein